MDWRNRQWIGDKSGWSPWFFHQVETRFREFKAIFGVIWVPLVTEATLKILPLSFIWWSDEHHRSNKSQQTNCLRSVSQTSRCHLMITYVLRCYNCLTIQINPSKSTLKSWIAIGIKWPSAWMEGVLRTLSEFKKISKKGFTCKATNKCMICRRIQSDIAILHILLIQRWAKSPCYAKVTFEMQNQNVISPRHKGISPGCMSHEYLVHGGKLPMHLPSTLSIKDIHRCGNPAAFTLSEFGVQKWLQCSTGQRVDKRRELLLWE